MIRILMLTLATAWSATGAVGCRRVSGSNDLDGQASPDENDLSSDTDSVSVRSSQSLDSDTASDLGFADIVSDT